MKIADIIRFRLQLQQISSSIFREPSSLLSWLGAVQAQDYHGGKWAMGLRLPGITDADIEQQIADRRIVRTWSLRGTLHFMAAGDVRWMLGLLQPRLLKLQGAQFRNLGMDAAFFKKSHAGLADILGETGPLTRSELKIQLGKKKIPTHEMRINFILWKAATDRLICLGPRKGKEFTYTLLGEWVPQQNQITQDEALAKLTLKYFSSRGPANLQDFGWWSGLTAAEVRNGIALLGNQLQKIAYNGQPYWMPADMPDEKPAGHAIYLLPGFDEYLVGYKDRSAALREEHVSLVMGTGNGVFGNTLLVNGRAQATWKRQLKRDSVVIQTKPFSGLKKTWMPGLRKAVKRYEEFLGLSSSSLVL